MAEVTKEQCIDANGKAQDLRRDGKLSAAREELRTCSNPSCPPLVRDDCAKRLDELEAAQPTIIFEARDASGHDAGDVKVTVDGRPLAERLDGTALRVDPGEHVFTFTAKSQSPVTQTFIIREGQKGRREPLVIGSGPTAPAPARPAAVAPTTEAAAAPPGPGAATPPTIAGEAPTAWKTVGWVLGGAGVIGLGVGVVFGALTFGDKSSAHCDANNVCDPGTTGGIKSAALASDLGWIAGGVLLASGAALVLFAPTGSAGTTAVRVAPVVTASGGSVVLGGSW